ncbi:MAG: PAS domain S-box protein [Acidobacteria bacterium]|nr:PAS domain S-box protein [Acidobacteriota bacterium]
MQAPDPHPQEARRLAALRALHLGGTPPEPRFDALTRTACRLFGVPTALITLVEEERLWFKSHQGTAATERPRELGFCGHAILGEGLFVVADALLDPRFSDNPLVAGEPGVRFYAGMPLRSPEGLPYGTLCLLDLEPRLFSAEDRRALEDLALVAETELRSTLSLELGSAFHSAVVEHSPVGLEVFDADSGQCLQVNEEAAKIIGAPREALLAQNFQTIASWKSTGLLEAARRVLETEVDESLELSLTSTFGQRMHVACRFSSFTEGGTRRLILAINDLSARVAAEEARQESETRFRQAFEASGIGMALLGIDGRWLKVNQTLCELLGYTEAEFQACTFQDLTHPDDQYVGRDLAPQLISGELPVLQADKRYRKSDGSYLWMRLTTTILRDRDGNPLHYISQLEDIHERKEAEHDQARLLAILEASPDFIGTADLQGRLKYHNRAALDLVGLPPDTDLSTLTIPDMHPAWASKLVLEEGLPVALAGGIWKHDNALLHRDGYEIPVSQVLMAHRDPEGNPEFLSTVMRDLRAQREAQSILRRAEERYRAMTENVPGVMYQFQVWPDGRVVFPFISRGIEPLYGIQPEAWRADPLWALKAILPEDRPSYEAAYAAAAAALGTFLWEGRTHTNRPGEVLWIRCQSQPSLQEDGSILWDGLVTDTTSLHLQAEEQARQAAFQRSLLQSAEVAIISTDLTGVVTSFNAHAEALLGWTEEEVVGKASPALWHDPEEVAARAAELGQSLGREFPPNFDVFVHQARMGGTEQRQWTFITRDGYRIPMLLTVSGIRDASDTLVGFMGIGADLRTLKAREAALRASEQQFRDLVASVPGIVFQTRPLPGDSREFTFVSDYTRVILGMDPGELLANPHWIEDMVLPEDRESLLRALSSGRTFRESTEWVGRIRRRTDGQTRWIRIQATPLEAPDGSILWNGLILDLTERISSHLALRESEERLALVLKGSNDAPWDWDLERGSLYYSPRWWDMLGYRDDELASDPELLNTLTHPEDQAALAAALETALEGGRESYEVEYRLRHKDGHYVPVLSRAFIQRDDHGRPHRLSGTNMDLTERKAVEEALRHSEERWSLALQANNDGIWDWNVLTNEAWFSPRYFSMLGYEPGELPGTMDTWTQLCHPEDLPGAMSQVQAYIAGRSSTYQLTFRMRHKDGSWRWILSRGVGKAGAEGRMVRIVGSHHDITLQREAEEALVASQARSQALLEAMPDTIFLVSREGIFLEIHAHDDSHLRLPREQILGKPMREVMPPDLVEDRMSRIARVLDTGIPESYETRLETQSGIQDHETRVVPCGRDTVLYIARDITERKALERLKSDFISTVSHELRTPLTSIKGALGLLAGGVAGELPGRAADLTRMALENANRLARLIDDLLDLAKTESAELRLDLRIHDLRRLLEQALEGIAAFAQSHEVDLQPTWAVEAAPARVDGDRLIQVVLNLVSNAVKYSRPGDAVQLRLGRRDRYWRLEVENHGPEIPTAFRARIFQKFAMADSSDTRSRGGTGLGLAISKALMERMGGTIDYHSAAGRTVFFVELPLAEEIP